MIKRMTTALFAILWFLYCFLFFSVSLVDAQKVTSVFEINQEKKLGGELYQTAFYLKDGILLGLTREKIVKIDLKGKISTLVNLLPGQRAILSNDGRFFSVMTHAREFIKHFELKTSSGENLFEKDIKGMFLSFLVSNDANMIVGVEATKPPLSIEVPITYHFYNLKGKELGQAKVINPTGNSFSPDGKAFVINDLREGMIAFSQNGLKLWSIGKPYRYFAVSNGARQVIGNSSSQIERIDLFQDGKFVGQYSFQNPIYNIEISPTGKFLVATDMRTVKFFKEELKVAWEYVFEDKSLTINSVDVSDSNIVACGLILDNGPKSSQEKRYIKGLAVLMDQWGKIIWKNEYNLNLSNAWVPKVSLIAQDSNKTILIVQTREKLFLYEIMF